MNKKIYIIFMVVALMCAFLNMYFMNTSETCLALSKKNKTQEQVASHATAAVLMEKNSERILFSKNADAKLPLASCTKILTALTVLKNCNPEEIVEVDSRAVGIEGSSIYLRTGEKLTVLELLYGLMLQSGNDCAVALACFVGGSVPAFAELMNKTACDCGATDSNFVNPHGLHSPEHYTTASDLGKITCNALKNDLFKKIVATKKINISNDGQENKRTIINKNKLLSGLQDADGVKTGYTKAAGRCFVGSATRNNMQLIAVVLNCGPMFEETADMLNYGFNNYEFKTIYPKNKIFCLENKNKDYFFRFTEGFSFPMNLDGKDDEFLESKLYLNEDKTLKIKITFAKKLIFSQQLSIIKG